MLFYMKVIMKKVFGLRLPGKLKVFYELNAVKIEGNHWFFFLSAL